jgi:hypothetical protein
MKKHALICSKYVFISFAMLLSSHEVMDWWLRLGSMAEKVVGSTFILSIHHFLKSQISGFNGLYDVIQQSTSNVNLKKNHNKNF